MALLRPSRLVALASAAAALAPQAPARTYFWAGGNRDFWGNDNWLQGDGSYTHPLSDRLNSFVFGRSSNGAVVLDDNGYTTNNIEYDFIAGSMDFYNQAYVLNGKSLLLYGRNTIDVDPSCPSLGIDLNLKMDNDFLDPTATLSLDVAQGSTLTVTGEIYGTGALYKADFGTAILKGFHNYTEGTNVAAGRLIDYAPHGNYYTNADLEFNIGGNVTHGGRVFGGGAVTKSGAGTLYLNGDASWTGATNVDAGRLIVATPWSSSSYGVSAGAALEFRTGTGNYTHDIVGGGSLTKSGPGTLTLSGDNTYTGGTTVTEGVLIDKHPHGGYANNSVLYFETAGNHTLDKPISGNGTLYKTGSGTVILAGLNTFTGGTGVLEGALIDYNPHGAYTVASELQFVGAHTYSNVISGGGHFTKGGAGVLTFTGTNTYTGGTTVDGGTLIDTHPHGDYRTNSQLEFRNANDLAFLDPNTGIPYIINGLGHFTKSGAGALVLFAPNSYAASTTINEGAIATLANNALPTTTDLTVGANGLLLLGSGISQTVASLAGAGRVTLQGNNLGVNGSASTEFSGVVSGNGALLKDGAGTLTLSGANAYTNGTTVSGGRLIDANPHGTYVTNAALEFSKATDYTYSTAITGTGSFTKSGAGILTLSGVNTYSNGTTVKEGRLIDLNPHGDYTTNATLEFKNVSSYGRTIDGNGTFVKSGSGTLSVTGSIKNLVKTQIAGGTLKGNNQSLQGDVTGVGGTTLQFDQTSNGTFAAKVSGAGALLKTGGGTLTMTNAPTHSGGVRVSGGTLRVNGGGAFDGGLTVDAGSTFRNASGGTLTAKGQSLNRGGVTTDGGSTTVFNGPTSGAGDFKGLGTVDFRGGYNPGASPASVRFSGDLKLSSTLTMELGGTTLGTGYDHLTVDRTAFLGGALDVAWYDGFSASLGQSFDLFDLSSSNGAFASISLPTLARGLEWNTNALYTTGTIRVQSVPEPASLAALGLGALALLRRRKRA